MGNHVIIPNTGNVNTLNTNTDTTVNENFYFGEPNRKRKPTISEPSCQITDDMNAISVLELKNLIISMSNTIDSIQNQNLF